MGAEERLRFAEDLGHVHPLLQRPDRNLAGGESRAELHVGLEFALILIADIENVPPQRSVLMIVRRPRMFSIANRKPD